MNSSRKICSIVLMLATFSVQQVLAQSIVDPCFASVSPIGRFQNSKDIINLCRCDSNFLAADLLEWNGEEWIGRLRNYMERTPPKGCNIRGMWLGYNNWTRNGEAIAMRLDKPLVEGEIYSYSFTYAKDGDSDFDPSSSPEFSPIVYTDKTTPSLYRAYRVGRLPGAVDWTTQSITFTATLEQAGHEWIILHGLESSGTILSNCIIEKPIQINLAARDTTLCQGSSLLLQAPSNDRYTYYWNTGEQTASIEVQRAGLYSVEINSGTCSSTDSISVSFEDCQVRFVMPNIFTPNGDEYNPVFIPIEHNYIESGILSIYNRWGEKVFFGDVFQGWNGSHASSGIYYYKVDFRDRAGIGHVKQGTVTLSR